MPTLFSQLGFAAPPAPEGEAPPADANAAAGPPHVWSVKHLVSALTRQVEQQFADVRVEGEISNCRPAASGHQYFTLKDGDAQLACVMFRSRASLLRFRLEDGLQVQARGRISVYEGRGQLQLIADSLEPLGDGAFRVAYEKLRERLEREGLFDADRKRPVPAFAQNIGVITSPTGAVIQDILNVLGRRHAGMYVLLYPATVQGPTAAEEFCAGLDWFQQQASPVDIVLLARGGGSLEDLHCFNDEHLARAIAACSIPVISAIGHETDFTIADFVADLRAPTPSAAAEIITAQHYQVEARVAELERRVERGFRYHLALARQRFQQLMGSTALANARDMAARRQQRLDDLAQRMAAAEQARLANATRRVHLLGDRMMRQGLQRRVAQANARCQNLATRMDAAARRSSARARAHLQQLHAQLQALSPAAILDRGYALVYDAQGSLLRNSSLLVAGQTVSTRVAQGSFRSAVIETTPKEQDAV